MVALWLPHEQARAVARHALDDAPREACGVLGGQDGRVTRVFPAPNVHPDPERAYTLDPAALVATVRTLRADGLDLIGFYHAHPAGDPIPSPSDIALATYPDAAYLIVGLRTGEPELAAWRMRAGRAERLPLHLGDDRPPPDDAPLSQGQKSAIILSALLALVLLLVVALALLPPAPEIPLP